MAMNLREIMALALLFLGVGIIVLACLGLLTGDVYNRLHFVGPPSVLAPWLIAAALAIQFSSTEAVIKGFLLAASIMSSSPILTHATAKMLHRVHYEKGIAEESVGHSN
jgi:multicomponent Na+:H+ antiporter subunit G